MRAAAVDRFASLRYSAYAANIAGVSADKTADNKVILFSRNLIPKFIFW